MDRAVRPTLRWLADHDADYRGVLYAGMMLTADGPKVIEYNVRFGDPECQVVLPRVASDVAELLRAAAAGEPLAVEFSTDACVTVVLASEGYPAVGAHRRRHRWSFVTSGRNGVTVFHAGTARDADGALLTAGGRVLDVTATGVDLATARAQAYDAAAEISWRGMQFRRDIAAAAASVAERRAARAHEPGDGSAPRR